MKSHNTGSPVYYNPWEYTEISSPGALVYLSIACTTHCNFACTFCSKKYKAKKHLDPGFLKQIIDQAVNLGLEKVELTGGEPFLYPWFRELTEYLSSRHISVFIVTNGSFITGETAAYLAAQNISVSISLSTLNEDAFNSSSGTRGQFSCVLSAVKLLKKAGFSHNRFPVCGIQSIASRQNLDEFRTLQDWAENQGCMFILNRPIPVGGMSCDDLITGEDLKNLLVKESNRADPVKVPFSLDSPCNRLKAGCYIDSEAMVYPCPSINSVAGSLHTQSLAQIWKESVLLDSCHHISDLLEGSCGRCEEKYRCYGCRAVAWASWGNLTGPDPGCFRFEPDSLYTRERIEP
ncbi:MAG: radical SAM protein [Spirochaetales bacterium]|nr:radical SAM protein [Spirochaetales bacterium]